MIVHEAVQNVFPMGVLLKILLL